MRLQAGTLLHGDTYQIEKVLGQGSFGITYLAVHTVLERKVCIKEFFMKEINTRNADGSITGMIQGSLSHTYGQKFKKEALNLSHLEHPNIVHVTDSFNENGTYYYVMDYIDGDNLNDYVKSNKVTQKEVLSIIRDVANALVYMHEEKHMLHLDLKPGNIMRRRSDGHIFLIDFGLSKHYSADGQPETSTSIGLGTAGYAPIEQANQMKSGEFRPAIDVYALGATLFKLLTRETPPPASDIVNDDELVEMKLRANGITGHVIDVVVNAMMPSVKKRTQSVRQFLDSLPYGTEENVVSPEPEPISTPIDEETEVLGGKSKETNDNGFSWFVFIAMTAIISLIIWFLSVRGCVGPQMEYGIAQDTIDTVEEDTSCLVEYDNVDMSEYDEKDPRVRLGGWVITGTKCEVTVREGQTLSSISKAYLGPDLECYVEVYNNVKEVKPGDVIKIPELKPKIFGNR